MLGLPIFGLLPAPVAKGDDGTVVRVSRPEEAGEFDLKAPGSPGCLRPGALGFQPADWVPLSDPLFALGTPVLGKLGCGEPGVGLLMPLLAVPHGRLSSL